MQVTNLPTQPRDRPPSRGSHRVSEQQGIASVGAVSTSRPLSPSSNQETPGADHLPQSHSLDITRAHDTLEDLEGQVVATPVSEVAADVKNDIEHMPVHDDPRLWSKGRKYGIVAIVSAGALIPALAANIYFPAIPNLEDKLNASQQSISLSVSLYILCQGTIPLLWAPVSELIGRKIVLLVAMAIFSIFSGFISLAPNMATLIALRAVAAAGSSACLSISAGTLADLFEVEERGAIVGAYYCAPITGPAIAPLFGGILTDAGDWEAVFWFQAGSGVAVFLGYCGMKETFRRERSAAWQKARLEAVAKAEIQAHEKVPSPHVEEESKTAHFIQGVKQLAHVHSKYHARKNSGAALEMTAPQHVAFQPPHFHVPGHEDMHTHEETHSHWPVDMGHRRVTVAGDSQDVQGGRVFGRKQPLRHVLSAQSLQGGRVLTNTGEEVKFKPSLADVSPLGSAIQVLKQVHNLAALFYSGIAFAAQYSLSFTATRTFQAPPYNFSPILIGCVLLSLGVGGIFGSVIGGRISDNRLKVIAQKTGKKAEPEERIKTIYIPMLLVLPLLIGYGWATEYHVHVAIPVVILLLLGYAQMHAYSVCLSYVVDSNPGRTSGAVAVNSAFRGFLAFVASEVSQPILDAVGNGPLQSGWAVLISLTVAWLYMTAQKGKEWRDEEWKWPRFWKLEQWRRGRVGGSRWVKTRQMERSQGIVGQEGGDVGEAL